MYSKKASLEIATETVARLNEMGITEMTVSELVSCMEANTGFLKHSLFRDEIEIVELSPRQFFYRANPCSRDSASSTIYSFGFAKNQELDLFDFDLEISNCLLIEHYYGGDEDDDRYTIYVLPRK